MGYFKAILVSLFVLFSLQQTCEAEELKTGTIIVIYQTEDAKHLDRIRFWLINENNQRSLYPKKDEYVANTQKHNERTVVISQLALGNYRIDFVFPKGKNFFEETESKIITVNSGSITKVNQSIKSKVVLNEELAEAEPIAADPPTPTMLPPYIPSGHSNIIINSPVYPKQPGYFSLNSNLSAHWKLMNSGSEVYAGSGSISNFPVRPAPNFYLIAEDIPGYTLQQLPPNPFDIYSDRTTNVDLYYQRDTGFISVQATLSSPDDSLIISILPIQDNRNPLQVNLRPIEGKIYWQSESLGTGEYLVNYKVPETYMPIANQQVYVEKGQITKLVPLLISKGTLEVVTDVPQATFTITNSSGVVVGQGQGTDKAFQDLDSGYYNITFSSADPQLYVPPPPQNVFVPVSQSARVQVTYSKSGKVNISSDLPKYKVTVQSIDNSKSSIETEVTNHNTQIYLPEGAYTIQFEAPSYDTNQQKTIELVAQAISPQNVYFSFAKAKLEYERVHRTRASTQTTLINNEPGIEIQTNLLDISASIRDLGPVGSSKKVRGRENDIFIPIKVEGTFQITFDPVPNYLSPQPIMAHAGGTDHLFLKVNFELGEPLVKVPAGPAIIGDPFVDDLQNVRPPVTMNIPEFEIAIFEVTNLLYSRWLTEAYKKGIVKFDEKKPGHIILAHDSTLYCKTIDGDPNSQIMTRQQLDELVFFSLPGKETHPVILVTWYGANAYCRDQGFRLPTEAQWEKAAGMALTKEGRPLKKYKFGFGQDTIDRRWANYHDSTKPITTLKVLTTPVGFYHGNNSLPLTINDRAQVFTENARSPTGAYDMSGNVWEWTASWDELDPADVHKVVKGGCYDSFPDGLRVYERLMLVPDYADIFTGFRAAKYEKVSEQRVIQEPEALHSTFF